MTGRVPGALQRRTAVAPGNGVFWEAFQMLSRTRRPSPLGGTSDILLPDILAYADLAKIVDPDLRTQLARVVVAMDDAYLGWIAERQPKEEPEARD